MITWFGMAPLILLVVFGLLLMVLDVFSDDDAELPLLTAAALLGVGALSGTLLAYGGVAAPPDYVTRYVAVDGMGLFFDVVICAGAAISVLLAGGYLREHGLDRGEFYILVLFSTFGAMLLARAVDLLSIFIGLETMSLGVYALVAYRRRSPRAIEGAVKYFLLGSFAAAIFLFGSALLYGATGHTNLANIASAIAAGHADPLLVLPAMAMLLAGLAFKVSAVPFHMWTPDAYEGAATPVTTFMSVAVKSAAFAMMLRVLGGAFGADTTAVGATGWVAPVAALAAVTMVYGNLAAVAQSSVKRMLAYSSIAHAGYAMVGVAAAGTLGAEALSAVLYYLLAYTVSNGLAFGSLVLMGSKGREAVSYEDLAGAGRRHPWEALPFAIGVLSLMGFPPLAGFFGKYYVFSAAVHAGGWMIPLAILGVLTAVVGAYYYLKVIVYLYMRDPQEDAPIAIPMRSGYVLVALVLAGYYVLKLGIVPGRYLDLALRAAS